MARLAREQARARHARIEETSIAPKIDARTGDGMLLGQIGCGQRIGSKQVVTRRTAGVGHSPARGLASARGKGGGCGQPSGISSSLLRGKRHVLGSLNWNEFQLKRIGAARLFDLDQSQESFFAGTRAGRLTRP